MFLCRFIDKSVRFVQVNISMKLNELGSIHLSILSFRFLRGNCNANTFTYYICTAIYVFVPEYLLPKGV